MKILVIGGSYFFGRWFVQLAHKDHEITVINRGSIKIGLDGIRELACDRHDEDGLKALGLSGEGYDTVVDFCAYEKGDIEGILRFLDTGRLSEYIFISTVDVYRNTGDGVIDEESPLADAFKEGPEGEYIAGKVSLEHELHEAAKRYMIKGISVRPAVLYGPLNYAPRESLYFEWIDRAGQILHPLGADGYWQMIYVRDAAMALKNLCELTPDETEEAYNFCSGERITYDIFEEALSSLGTAFEKVDVSVRDVYEKNIPLPFPLRAEESAYYSSERFMGLLPKTTPLSEGLKRSRNV